MCVEYSYSHHTHLLYLIFKPYLINGCFKVGFIKKRVNKDKDNIDVCVEDKQGFLKKLFKKRC
jgi:hypothetical protein